MNGRCIRCQLRLAMTPVEQLDDCEAPTVWGDEEDDTDDGYDDLEALSLPPDPNDPLVGWRLGGYRILERISRGGMGMVYRARDLALERLVALKVLAPEICESPDFIARFQREARAVAALSHPNIVPIFGIGEQDGYHFFAMEYVDGVDLSRHIRAQGPLSPLQTVRVAIRVACALEAAHGAGIVHRDIKPQNIMIHQTGRIQVLDFGLVTFTDPTRRATTATSFLGTPSYASPEQCEGGDIDGRSDLYALGVVLFECLTGRLPYQAQSPGGLVREIMTADTGPLLDALPEVPKALRDLIARLMEKRPDDRYGDAKDFLRHAEEVERELMRQGGGASGALTRTVWLEAEIAHRDEAPEGGVGSDGGADGGVDDGAKVRAALRQALEECGGKEAPCAQEEEENRAAEDDGVADDGASDGAMAPAGAAVLSARFEHPMDAVRAALSLQRIASERRAGVPARVARMGIHLDESYTDPGDLHLPSDRETLEDAARSMAGRMRRLASPGQTLLTHTAFDAARRETLRRPEDRDITWVAHGPYSFEGVADLVEVFEVGVSDAAPLAAPHNQSWAKSATRLGDEATLGWRPAAGLEIPTRPLWRLARCVGQGGFGEVWLARHIKTDLQRIFKFCFEARRLHALKREVTLFRLLKQTLGNRPDIYKVLDWSFEEPPFYIESEYTEGGSLIDWSREQGGLGAVPLETRLELVAQAATALAAAHSVGLIHRDIKPGNILVRRQLDGEPRAVLSDFGVGLVTGADVFAGQNITVTGMTELVAGPTSTSLSGTRLYLAPELLEGKPLTTLADIYALGVLLFQMAIGDFGRTLGVGWRREITDDLLADDIAACVDHDPSRRLSSASELAHRLRTLEDRRAALRAEEEARQEAIRAKEEAHRQAQEATARLERTRRQRKALAIASSVGAVFLAVVSTLALIANANRRDALASRQETAEANQRLETTNRELEYDLYISDLQKAQRLIEDGALDRARELLFQQPRQHRHWEWGHLLDLCHPELLRNDIKDGLIVAFKYAYSPRKTWYALIPFNDNPEIENRLHIYDTQTGHLRHVIHHTDSALDLGDVSSWAFTPDESHLLVGTASANVVLYKTDCWEYIDHVALPSTVEMITTGGRYNYLIAFTRERSSTTGRTHPRVNLNVLQIQNQNGATNLQWLQDDRTTHYPYIIHHTSPDGRWLAIARDDPDDDGGFGFELWDYETGTMDKYISCNYSEMVQCLTFLPGGDRVLSASFFPDEYIKLWDRNSGNMLNQYPSHDVGSFMAMVSNDTGTVTSIFRYGLNIVSRDLRTGITLANFRPDYSALPGVSLQDTWVVLGHVLPDESMLTLTTMPNTRLSRVRNEKVLFSAPMGCETVNFPSILSHSAALVPSAERTAMEIHNLFPEMDRTSWEAAYTTPSAMTFSRDGTLAAVYLPGDHLGLMTVADRQIQPIVFRGPTAIVRDVDFSPDLRRMVTVSDDETVRVWDVATGQELLSIAADARRARFSDDGAALAIGYGDGTATLLESFPWDAYYDVAEEGGGATSGSTTLRVLQQERYGAWMAEREGQPLDVMAPDRADTIRRLLDRPRPRPERMTRELAEKWLEICLAYAPASRHSEKDKSQVVYDMLLTLHEMEEWGEIPWDVVWEGIMSGAIRAQVHYKSEAWFPAYPEHTLPDEHPNSPRNPANRRRETDPDDRRILGHWDFSRGDLSGAIGQYLAIHDPSQRGRVEREVRFGTDGDLDLPPLGDEPTRVISHPAFQIDEGLVMTLGHHSNGGGRFLNQYTIIADIYTPETRSGSTIFLKTFPIFVPRGELYFPALDPGWHRVVFRMDISDSYLRFNARRYVNGDLFSLDELLTFDKQVDGRFALRPINLLLAGAPDEVAAGYVSCIQVRNYAMSEREIAALGGPEPGGVPLEIAFLPNPEEPWTLDKAEACLFALRQEIHCRPYHQRYRILKSAYDEFAALPGMTDYFMQRVAMYFRDPLDIPSLSQDNPFYNLMTWNPGLELPHDHPNKLPDRSQAQPPTATPAPAVLAYWDFSAGDLSPAVGRHPLTFYDPGETGAAQSRTRIAPARELGILDLPGGTGAPVLAVPDYAPDEGIEMRLDLTPNGGGFFQNQYTLIMDIYRPEVSDGKRMTLLWTHTRHSILPELSIAPDGILGSAHRQKNAGPLAINRWYRIGVVVDLTRPPDRRNPVEDGNMRLYIDGKLAGQESVFRGLPAIDSNFALRPINLLFTDRNVNEEIYISAIQVRNYPMSEWEMALLGRPQAEGIDTELRLDLNRDYRRWHPTEPITDRIRHAAAAAAGQE